ncbi:MAG: hypothetical protein WB567_11035, partial [Terracidiphilus sp.]
VANEALSQLSYSPTSNCSILSAKRISEKGGEFLGFPYRYQDLSRHGLQGTSGLLEWWGLAGGFRIECSEKDFDRCG